jgi:cohesin loading factor subunit SCC2
MHDVPGVRSALEELITACLLVVKSHLTQIMYPFVENSGNPDASLEGIFTARPYLVGEAFGRTCRPGEAASSTALRAQLSELLQVVRVALPKVNKLEHSDAMAISDGIVIQAAYIAIGTFFLVKRTWRRAIEEEAEVERERRRRRLSWRRRWV